MIDWAGHEQIRDWVWNGPLAGLGSATELTSTTYMTLLSGEGGRTTHSHRNSLVVLLKLLRGVS